MAAWGGGGGGGGPAVTDQEKQGPRVGFSHNKSPILHSSSKKKKQKKKLECEEVDPCPPKAHCLLCYIHPAQRSLLFFAFNTLTRGHLQPTASLTSDFKFKCARVSASVFIWQEWTWVHYQRSWQRACTEGKFLKCSHHHCGALGVSPRRQRAAALLWLSSAIGFSVPLRYIKSQIEMTWPVYLVGGMQCVRRPAVAGR